MSLEGINDPLENDDTMLIPSIPELEARIQVLEIRNADLEIRNIALTKTVSLLANLDIDVEKKRICQGFFSLDIEIQTYTTKK